VQQRDRQDSERAIAPLKQADDAVLVDSSSMPLDEVVQLIVQTTRRALDHG
jgi:cytidylate kinase